MTGFISSVHSIRGELIFRGGALGSDNIQLNTMHHSCGLLNIKAGCRQIRPLEAVNMQVLYGLGVGIE